jgi:hypothetical protein
MKEEEKRGKCVRRKNQKRKKLRKRERESKNRVRSVGAKIKVKKRMCYDNNHLLREGEIFALEGE